MNPGTRSDPNTNIKMNMNINTRDAISPIPIGTSPKTGGTSNDGGGDLNVTWPAESSHYKILGKVGRGAFATVYKALATTTIKTAAGTTTAASTTNSDKVSDASTNEKDTAACSCSSHQHKHKHNHHKTHILAMCHQNNKSGTRRY